MDQAQGKTVEVPEGGFSDARQRLIADLQDQIYADRKRFTTLEANIAKADWETKGEMIQEMQILWVRINLLMMHLERYQGQD